MKRLAVAFSGPSNSGKTTLILKVAKIFLESKQKVAIIKHDPGNKAKFDIKGKDSYKFSEIGADVAVLSPKRSTYFFQKEMDIQSVIDMFGDFDFLIVEGLKTLPLPRISLFRGKVDESYLPFSNAIATDGIKFDTSLPNLDINNPEEICRWIEKNAKKV